MGEGNKETSAIEILVNKLLERIEEKAFKQDDNLVRELANKVYDHDKTLVLATKTMEDINKVLGDFAESAKGVQKEMMQYRLDQQKHWSNQDMLMKQNENILKQLADGQKKFDQIEERQLKGCPSQIAHEKESKMHIERFKESEASLKKASELNRQEIAAIDDKVIKLSESHITLEKRFDRLDALMSKIFWSVGVGALVTIG